MHLLLTDQYREVGDEELAKVQGGIVRELVELRGIIG